MLEITSGRGPTAARPGTGGVADLGQVPQHDPGIVTVCLVAVVAVPGGNRPMLMTMWPACCLHQHRPVPRGDCDHHHPGEQP